MAGVSDVVGDTICRMFEKGIDIAAIGSALKLGPSAVMAALVKGGVGMEVVQGRADEGDQEIGAGFRGKTQHSEVRMVGKEMRELILRAYRDFKDVSKFCVKMGISSSEFFLVVAEEGEKVRGRPPERVLGRKRRDEEVASLYEAGVKISEIKRLVGLRRISQVHEALAREGVGRDVDEERSRKDRRPSKEELDSVDLPS